MPRYPKAFLDQLNTQTNIYDLISEYTALTPAGNHIFTGLCPLPDHHETNGSLTVFTHSNSWSCFGCGAGSNALAFLTKVNNWNFHQAVEHLCEKHGIQKPTNERFLTLFKNNHKLEGFYHRLLIKNSEGSYDYLLKRGLKPETIGKWGLGTNKKNRIIFPLYDRDMNIIEFSMRYIVQPKNKNDKYWHPSNYSDKKKGILKEYYNKSNYLYGIHLYDAKKSDYVYFCEGNLDVILATQEGLPNCLSTFGTHFSEAHLNFLQTTKKHPVFIYDGDKAGLKGMHKACQMCIDAAIKPYVVILDEQIDLADLAIREKENLVTFIMEAVTPYAYYVIKEALNAYEIAYKAFYLAYYERFEKALACLDQSLYLKTRNYIYQKTNLLIDVSQLISVPTNKQSLRVIDDLLEHYHQALFMLQAPYYTIFTSSLRTLNQEDKKYAQTFIYEITGLWLEE